MDRAKVPVHTDIPAHRRRATLMQCDGSAQVIIGHVAWLTKLGHIADWRRCLAGEKKKTKLITETKTAIYTGSSTPYSANLSPQKRGYCSAH